MKRMISIFFLALLMAVPLNAFAETTRGDVNNDGNVSIVDVTVLVDYLLSGDESAVNMENADCNLDGNVTIADLTALIDCLLSGGWEPYAPQTETFTVNGVSFTMVVVESGTFMMGATAEQGTTDPDQNEYPVHQVTLSTYRIGQTEVTQELWVAVMGAFEDSTSEYYEQRVHPFYFSSRNGFPENPQRPVESIKFSLISLFLTRLNRLTGMEFRLPTEAEWEFAARGGNLSKGYKYAGSNNLDEVAWYRNNSYVVGPDSPDYGTHAVGTKAPNELGLYDMSGNVLEACYDVYIYDYTSEPQIDPIYHNTSGNTSIARGGNWKYGAINCRVSCRSGYPIYTYSYAGFRLAL